MVKGDAFSLREAARNLVTNALAHGKRPVRLRVSVTGDGKALIAAEDQGPGMSAAQLERIGERFARDASNPRSAGLGLAIVAEVAGFHQGAIRTATRAGDGFEVGIELPLAETHPATQPEGDAA